MTAIKIEGLTKRFGKRTAVDHLTLDIESGEVFGLLGANGAGKTTTIRMLCGLTQPSAGDAIIYGDSVVTATNAVKGKINVSPQETAVAAKLTVKENLELIARLYGSDRAEAKRRADQVMRELRLVERAGDRAKTLSGGLQRRLSIAMALITEPKVLFLDEPTLGLDVRARRDLWKVIEELHGRITVILTSHYLEEVEHLADRIAIMDAGKVCAMGTVGKICEQTGKETLEEAFLALTDGDKEE
ncbi:MAG: ABC transporter ATP-binding protein [Clostridiaceae bacterium]|nr:ABC transporter ATP-binding protein [Clostridiaceae bacterium]